MVIPDYPLQLFMSNFNLTLCADACSGHGDCYDGTCFCEVQYSGGTCMDPNINFYIAFSTIFYLIGSVSFIQLCLCIRADYTRHKERSLRLAFQLTIQKLLYMLIFLATTIRGYYFSTPENSISFEWASSLLSAFYPLLLSGGSCVICVWAELFHIPQNSPSEETPRFLNKSYIGFIVFNLLVYSLLITELSLLHFTSSSQDVKNLVIIIFKCSYTFLLLIVLVFFLAYGVEMYFKVRGQFTKGSDNSSTDMSQLQQSRLGLLSQSFFLLVTIIFLLSEIFGIFWKDKVDVTYRNLHQICYRVVEIGVALWFPCVLWNCFRPEQLWILNPRKLLKTAEGEGTTGSESEALVLPAVKSISQQSEELRQSYSKLAECWICYDPARQDMGAIIQPCNCKGDVASVHHDCLKKWLIESASKTDNLHCKVCKEQYQLINGHIWLATSLNSSHWIKTSAIVSVMGMSVACSCLTIRMFTNVGARVLSVGIAILIVYVGLRLLGISFLTAYQKARFSAVKILGRKAPIEVSTISMVSSSLGTRLLDVQNSVIIVKGSTSTSPSV